jgi:lysozyme
MNQKSEVIPLLEQEEGTKLTPYIDSLGYPSVGTGFKIGPKGAQLSNYTFELTQQTNDVWLQSLVDTTLDAMVVNSSIHDAMCCCNQARQDILTSMAYQMGVEGLSEFHHMLQAICIQDWNEAAAQMLDSTWAKQTPERANRHADVMRSGQWAPTYNF